MISMVLIACTLVAATVITHAVGLTVLLQALSRPNALPTLRFWRVTWLLIRVTWSLVLIHVVEITIWALFYLGLECLPDGESAFYFSGVTYATVGYGDLVLAKPWRMLGPVEGLTGILMCGLSTGFFFAVLSRIYATRTKADRQ